MNFPVELFCFRKNEEKTPMQICWRAATAKHYIGDGDNKVTKQEIDNVDIVGLCDDILSGIRAEGRPRFALHLSSNLMYGSLKLFRDQVEHTEEKVKNLFFMAMGAESEDSQINKKSKSKKNKIIDKNDKIDEVDEPFPGEIPEVNVEQILSKKTLKDINLIEEIDFIPNISGSHVLPSFGAFETDSTNIDQIIFQMNQELISPRRLSKGKNSPSLHTPPNQAKSSRNAADDQAAMDVEPDSFNNSPPCNSQSSFKTPTRPKPPITGIPQETPSPSERAHTAYSPIKVRSPMLREQAALVNLTPPQAVRLPGVLNEEENDVTMRDAEISAPVPEGVLEAIEPEVVIDEFSGRNTLSLESEGINFKPTAKIPKRGKKVFADTQITLPLEDFPAVNVFTKSFRKPLVTWSKKRETAQTLFLLPATFKSILCNSRGSLWTTSLLNLYQGNLQKPCQPASIVQHKELEKQIEEMEVDEVREETSVITREVKLLLQRVNKLENSVTNIKIPDQRETSDDERQPVDNILPMDFIESDMIEIDQQEQLNLKETKVMDNVPSENDDIIKSPALKRFRAGESELESTKLNEDAEISNFFASVKRLWDKKEKLQKNKNDSVKIDFNKVVIPSKNRVSDATKYLLYCFNLENERKMCLEQERPYAPLYLVKPQ